MSSPSFQSVRDRCVLNFSKNFAPEFSTRLESKLFHKSDKTETNYRQLFKIAIQLIKDDTMKNELSCGKLSLNDFLYRVLHQNQSKTEEIKDLEWQRNEEKAIEIQKVKEVTDAPLVNAVKAAKAASAEKITSPISFVNVGDASLALFSFGSPNLSFLLQAQKSYARAESLDSNEEYRLNNYLSFYLKRFYLSLIIEDYTGALKFLNSIKLFHIKSMNNMNNNNKELKLEFPLIIVNEYIESIKLYFHSIKQYINNSCQYSPYYIKKLLKEIPNKNITELSNRKIKNFNQLQNGDNNGMGIIMKILLILDRSSLLMNKYFQQLNWPKLSNGDNQLLGDSKHRIPAYSIMVSDVDGVVFPVSIYNVHGNAELKVGDCIIILDPCVKTVSIAVDEADSMGIKGAENRFSTIHSDNPNFLFVNFKHWARDDIAIFYS